MRVPNLWKRMTFSTSGRHTRAEKYGEYLITMVRTRRGVKYFAGKPNTASLAICALALGATAFFSIVFGGSVVLSTALQAARKPASIVVPSAIVWGTVTAVMLFMAAVVMLMLAFILINIFNRFFMDRTPMVQSLMEARREADAIDALRPARAWKMLTAGPIDRMICRVQDWMLRIYFYDGERNMELAVSIIMPLAAILILYAVISMSGFPYAFMHPEAVKVDPLMLNDRGQPVYVIKNESSVNVSYQAVVDFIIADQTDANTYQDFWFTCTDYAARVYDAAQAAGIKCGIVGVKYAESTGHAILVFNTTDRGPVYIDVTGGDFIANVTIGELYSISPLPGSATMLPGYYEPWLTTKSVFEYW